MRERYKYRSGQLRKILRREILSLAEGGFAPGTLSSQYIIQPPFGATYLKSYEEWYVYNVSTQNVICTARYMVPSKEIVVRYRPASLYANIMKNLRVEGYTVLTAPSNNLGRRRNTIRDRLHQKIAKMTAGFKKTDEPQPRAKLTFDTIYARSLKGMMPTPGVIEIADDIEAQEYVWESSGNNFRVAHPGYPDLFLGHDLRGRAVVQDTRGRWRYMDGRFASPTSVTEARALGQQPPVTSTSVGSTLNEQSIRNLMGASQIRRSS